MSKEALIKLVKIAQNQQRILTKLSQMAPLTQRSPTSEDVYMDPDSDIASDLREGVSALTNEPNEMGASDYVPNNPQVIKAHLESQLHSLMRKYFPNLSGQDIDARIKKSMLFLMGL